MAGALKSSRSLGFLSGSFRMLWSFGLGHSVWALRQLVYSFGVGHLATYVNIRRESMINQMLMEVDLKPIRHLILQYPYLNMESERRCEELVTQVPESTRPLLRQIEAIQETTARKAEAWNVVDGSLNSRLQGVEAKAAGAEERKCAVNERLSQTLSRINVLEAQISCLRTEQTQLTKSLEKERQRGSESRQDYLALKEEADTHEGRDVEREKAARLELEKAAHLQSSVVPEQNPIARTKSAFENGLARRLSNASSVSSMEESFYLQASLDSSDTLSERQNPGEPTLSSYHLKSKTPNAYEAALMKFSEKHNKFIVLAEIHDTKFALNIFRYFYSEIQKPTDSVFYQEAGGFGSGKYKMRPGWQLHLYISQLPCGDASLNSQLLPCLNSSTKEGFAISSTTKLNDMMEEFLESSMKNNVILGTTGRKQGTSAKGAMHPSSESTLCKKRMLESFLSLSRSLANFPLSETSYLRLKEKAEEYNSALKIFKESPQFSNWLVKPLQFEPPVLVDTNGAPVATRLGWVPLQSLPDHVPIHLLNALMESLSSNWEFVEMERLHHTLQQLEIELAKTKEKSGNNYGGSRTTQPNGKDMVTTRHTDEFTSNPAFEAAFQRRVDALLPSITARIATEMERNRAGTSGGSGGSNPPNDITTWLGKFSKEKPKSFSSVTSPSEAEYWLGHIEKIFEVLACGDEFKARLAAYKFEGDALNWWKSYKAAKGDDFMNTLTWAGFREIFLLHYFPVSEQEKFEREYHNIHQYETETSTAFMKRFLRLAGFMGAKAGSQAEQAKKFKWALRNEVLEGIVNTHFDDVAQVANAVRNVEILKERAKQGVKRNYEGEPVRSGQSSGQRGSNAKRGDRRGDDYRGYGRQEQGSYRSGRDYQHRGHQQRDRQDRGRQDSPGSGSYGQRGYDRPEDCKTCGKRHPGQCNRVTGACFICNQVGHMARDCPKSQAKDHSKKAKEGDRARD
ncbi:golgin candidate 5 [Artemisia annua]|uniref:Golgin candidate 5 n=1 Tax=Artemisia annua TaxID=35608 RepID=A0A2U1QMS8_ARTAN|nr:golgin candidate 5 [Artemisia annua]